MKKLPKIICEICGETDKNALHYHHIIPRTDPDCTNKPENIAVICSSCHSKHHLGSIEILGVLPSTKLPYSRVLIFKRDGKCNVPGVEEHITHSKPKSIRIIYGQENKK